MKKIMFNDRYGLTEAVLEGRKTMTRRIVRHPEEVEINGHKYETLVLDMIEMMNGCLAFEIERSREFAPIKNMHGVDSVDSARELLKQNGVEL